MTINRIGIISAAFLCYCCSNFLLADSGSLEINQACIASGCFPGDDPDFPVEITSSGRYVLTGPVSMATPDVHAILIQADQVELDLNGFSLDGPNSGAASGVRIESNSVTIRRGYIRDFGRGISVDNTATQGKLSRVESIVSTSHSNGGIILSDQATIIDCTVADNGSSGIVVGDFSTISGSTATNNGSNGGIIAGDSSVVRNNVSSNNPLSGIEVQSGSVVTGNSVQDNGTGILAEISGNIVSNNSVYSNTSFGIVSGGNSLIRGNVAFANGTNFDTCATCTVIDNHGF